MAKTPTGALKKAPTAPHITDKDDGACESGQPREDSDQRRNKGLPSRTEITKKSELGSDR